MRTSLKHRSLVNLLLGWYARHGRSLPWRNIANPYRILLSEIMLQQTQVERVLIKYPEFLRRFPTLRSLARAPRRDVVVAWRGLGYNNRAVRLHRLANAVIEKHGGKIPPEYDSLVALPGVGRYTANAILASAFRKDVPAVDVNVRRFLSRVMYRMTSTSAMRGESEIWQRTTSLLPRGRGYVWNQALMDIGATICTARRPQCGICPVATFCASRTILRHTAPPHAKKEPSLAGIPNRLYRGRIVELLRDQHVPQSVRADVLGKCIYPMFSPRNARWLGGLLEALRRDGLIVIRGNGSLHTQRVSLA
jgi:A/G-specific adenine glycosylase